MSVRTNILKSIKTVDRGSWPLDEWCTFIKGSEYYEYFMLIEQLDYEFYVKLLKQKRVDLV